MSIAYLDPGNIESDLQSGTVASYKVINSIRYMITLIIDSVIELVIIDALICLCLCSYLTPIQ